MKCVCPVDKLIIIITFGFDFISLVYQRRWCAIVKPSAWLVKRINNSEMIYTCVENKKESAIVNTRLIIIIEIESSARFYRAVIEPMWYSYYRRFNLTTGKYIFTPIFSKRIYLFRFSPSGPRGKWISLTKIKQTVTFISDSEIRMIPYLWSSIYLEKYDHRISFEYISNLRVLCSIMLLQRDSTISYVPNWNISRMHSINGKFSYCHNVWFTFFYFTAQFDR